MLKQVGSVVVAGLVGAMSYSAQGDQPNPMIPIALAGGAFLASSVLFNKLEPDLTIPTVATPSVTHAAQTLYESGKKKGKKAVKAAKTIVAAPEPASPSEDEEPEEEPEEEEAPAPAKKAKKGKKAAKKEEKKAAPAPVAAAPKAKETPKKAAKKEEKKAAAAPAPAPAAAKKAEKKEEKKKPSAPAPKKAPVEEKKAAAGDKKKKGKKGEEKKAPVAAAPEPTGSDEEDEDGWKVVKRNDRPQKVKSEKGASGDRDATAATPEKEEKKKPETEDRIKIEPEKHGIIIGAGGKHIELLKQKTGADIQVPKQGSNDYYIKISGPADAVRNAKSAIAQLASQGWSKATHEGWDSSELKLNDEKDRGLIIGVRGANIQQLQTKYNVQIKTPAATETTNVISVSGEKDNVRDCKAAIRRILELGYNPEVNTDFIVRSIPVTKQQVMIIVGSKGSQIKHITKTTKIYRINTPKKDDDEQVVTLIGTPTTVEHAERMINNAIAPAEPEEQWSNDNAVFDENSAWN